MSFLAFIKNGKKVKNNFMPAKYPASRVSYDDNGTETNLQAKVSELNADMVKRLSANYTVRFNDDSAKAVNITTLFPNIDTSKIIGILVFETTSTNEFNYTYRKVKEDVVMRTHNDGRVTGDFVFNITALIN